MKILYFFPDNPLQKTQGSNSRALALLEYFKRRNIEVDFVGIASKIFSQGEISQLKEERLISKGYLLPQFRRSKNQLRYFFCYSLPDRLGLKVGMFDRTRFAHFDAFNKILKSNEYDIIIISYAYWGKLVDNNAYVKNAKLIIDTHDLLTSQFQNTKRFKLGKFFEKEVNIIKKFDEILAISNEEKYLFSQFIDKKIVLVTHSLPPKKDFKKESIYDLIYIASANEHNVKSAQWFFDKVYPLLATSLKIVVIGKICNHINDFPNVEKINYIEDLELFYSQTKIAICPMLSGTGLKIKVIEALSYGLPVVCNERGVDGLLNKTHNGCLVTNDKHQFASYINKLITDVEFHKKLNAEATVFFSENHSNRSAYKVLDEIFVLNKI